ncbi:sensor domain-containing diguanylate cyclase [Ramlibacter albus]|uniref:Diguanylate cyclase n=1 Tax=Ramlibacter albus TaxID=2079448 RepID=A0A923M9Q2_9BURK|nr:7TM diverse intracellular signaling domain-containing protein [Ramlibacter albus]MBC5765478.1 diguanylate cyclase [Ramlibacter albus]
MGLLERARAWLGGALLVTCMAMLGATPASARHVLELDVARGPVQLLDWGDAWVDEGPQAKVERVASDPSIPWQPTHEGAIYRLDTHKALWVRFTVPPAPDHERWYLEVPYPSVNRVTLYTQDSAGEWQSQSAGDTLPVADWPVPYRHPLMPIQVSAEVPRKYLVKIENPHSFSAPLTFVSDSYLARSEQRTSLVLGMYFGLVALSVIVALLSAVSLQDTAYGWYAAVVGLMGLGQGAMTGVAGLHLWPNWPYWHDLSSMVLPVAAVAAMQGFVSSLVSLPERSRRLHWLLRAVSALGIVVIAVIVLSEPSYRFRIMVPYIVLGTSVGTAANIWAAWRGDRFAVGLLVGTIPVLIGAAFPLARLAGLIPVSFATMHGMQLGIALELPILLVILMLRSQHRRENRRRILKIDRVDPATGLINGFVFNERLVQMMARSVRLKYRSAVLLVDIANIEDVRRQYGRAAADELPLRVAGRLLSSAREIDSVARLSENRFGILLEGPLTAGEVAEAAPRVVARCLMPFKNRPIDWVAQARVAQALIPMDGTDPEDVLTRLEALLANVPADSKRAVFTLPRDPTPTAVSPGQAGVQGA